MHSFKDATGEEWNITLDTFTAKEIKEELGLDLLQMDEQTTLALSRDVVKLVDTFCILLQSQIQRRELDAKGFAQRLPGGVLERAVDALVSEVVFISLPDQAEVIGEIWKQTKQASNQIKDRTLEEITSPQMKSRLESIIQGEVPSGTQSTSVS